MASQKNPIADLAAELIIGELRDAVELVRDRQTDGAQCHPNADYRAGWIEACERILDAVNAKD